MTATIYTIDENQSFTTVCNGDFSTMIQFHTSEDTIFLDASGNIIDFSALMPDMTVHIRFADFMTASLPPQTVAFEVQIAE